jgi:CDP-diacylglycerol--glycerol-3-phosphate 3-phosphatidyltransferase
VESNARRPTLLNVPNLLSLSRLPLSAVLFACIAAGWWWAGLVVFAAAAITDWLDGLAARRMELVSSFGRMLDPLVDKVLICGAFVFLSPLPEALLPPWAVTVVVAREFLVTGLRGYLEQEGIAFGADTGGKVKMVLQCIVLAAALLLVALGDAGRWEPVRWAYAVLVGLMLAATVASGVQYVAKAGRHLR